MARIVDVVVISDTHLGTYGCQAKELLSYLKSIAPKTLIINGDFIDIWQFKKSYFPKHHLKVIKKIIDMATKGTEVVYILGNHDEFLRRFSDTNFGNIELTNKKHQGVARAWNVSRQGGIAAGQSNGCSER